MISYTTLSILMFSYAAFVFLVSRWVDKKHQQGFQIANNPWIYTLSIAVFCTSWAFYGSVGKAATAGMSYLAVSLGSSLSMFLWWAILRKMVRIKNRFRITSIIDLIAARYDKSQGIGLIAALLVVIGIVPYIALQLKSITQTIGFMIGESVESTHAFGSTTGYAIAGLMIFFTIVLGLRRVDSTERHPGLIVSLAIESLVKVVALVAVGIFVTYFLHDGFDDILVNLPKVVGDKYAFMGIRDAKDAFSWINIIVASFVAIMFLPRQFHTAVVENFDEKHIRTAAWGFNLYLFLMNIFVTPIAIAGLMAGLDIKQADNFVLLLPLNHGQEWLALLTFIGGFSAAAGMVVLETVAVSTMISNNIILPIINKFEGLYFLRQHVLRVRWISAVTLILSAYFYMNIIGDGYALLAMGMISFMAVFQFAPLVFGALYWKKGSMTGAYIGLSLGFAIWFYTLFLPAFMKSGFISDEILREGLFGLKFLRPEALFNLEYLDNMTHSMFWSLIFNLGGYVLGSLIFEQSSSEQKIAEEFTEPMQIENHNLSFVKSEKIINLNIKLEKVKMLIGDYYSIDKTNKVLNEIVKRLGLLHEEAISIVQLSDLYEEVERTLSSAIGSAAASQVVRKSNLIDELEREKLSEYYSRVLAEMRIDPKELNKRISLYKEREKLLAEHTLILEETIQKRTRELEEQRQKNIQASKMSALGEMAAGVAHEINNPLAIIKGYLWQLGRMHEKKSVDSVKAIDIIEKSRNATDRIAKIIKGLKAFSRDGTNDPYEKFSIKEIIEDTLALCEKKIQNTGIKIIIDEIPKEASIHCQSVQIVQVMVNLLNNSRDAIEKLNEKWIKISFSESEENIEIVITDSGRGIPADIVNKIMDPFFTTKEVGKGTGLGLSISKGIIEKHKGILEYVKDISNTQFRVVLPKKLKLDESEKAAS